MTAARRERYYSILSLHVGALRPLPIRRKLIIFNFYNITVIVNPLFRAFPFPFFRGPRADLIPSPECLTIFGVFDPATRTYPKQKGSHGTFVFPLRVMASAPPTPTNSPDPTLDVSNQTAIGRQCGGVGCVVIPPRSPW